MLRLPSSSAQRSCGKERSSNINYERGRGMLGLTIRIEVMSRVCQITGKRAISGNNVSHSNHRTRRQFDVNLFSKKFYWPEEGCWIKLKISATGLRLINRVGLNEAIRRAVEKGYLTEATILENPEK